MNHYPVIAVSMGDPAGIGPELAVRTAEHFRNDARILLIGAAQILLEAARRFTPEFDPEIVTASDLTFDELHIGHDEAEHGAAALASVKMAVETILRGAAEALVTAPMSKAAVQLDGLRFTGHTEYIADMCHTADFAMMQSAENIMHVAFCTTHIPLRDVAKTLTSQRIYTVGKLLAQRLIDEGIPAPKIAVCALNPHGGEQGFIGDEEQRIIQPAIELLRAEKIDVSDPIVPDVLFIPEVRSAYDGIVCMYHDQGHIPFKMLAFHCGVNSTLGLPIIRTSPDHGTAYPIAWQGKADSESMFAAVRTALKLCR